MTDIFDWKCSCGKDSSKLGPFEELVPNDPRSHTPGACVDPLCVCGLEMTSYGSESTKFREFRKIDAVFDYVFQIWRKQTGEPIISDDEGDDWAGSCSSCSGPAKMTSCDSYFEYYECLNCKQTFKGN